MVVPSDAQRAGRVGAAVEAELAMLKGGLRGWV